MTRASPSAVGRRVERHEALFIRQAVKAIGSAWVVLKL